MSSLKNLIAAYESRDFTAMTLVELFQLVEQKFLRPETAVRLAREAGHVG